MGEKETTLRKVNLLLGEKQLLFSKEFYSWLSNNYSQVSISSLRLKRSTHMLSNQFPRGKELLLGKKKTLGKVNLLLGENRLRFGNYWLSNNYSRVSNSFLRWKSTLRLCNLLLGEKQLLLDKKYDFSVKKTTLGYVILLLGGKKLLFGKEFYSWLKNKYSRLSIYSLQRKRSTLVASNILLGENNHSWVNEF